MTAVVLNKSLNKIHSLASNFANSMIPFFFVKNSNQLIFSQQSNLTYKVNRQMTPLLENLPQTVRLAFWNVTQFESSQISNQTLKKSLILNPYKTQNLIRSALNKGIKKMLVSDIQEVIKIQECYFKLRKNDSSVEQPQYIWNVQNQSNDAQNIIDLQQCDLPFHGFYFTKQMTMKNIQNFLELQTLKNKQLQNFKEISLQNLQKQTQQIKLLKQYGIQPLITNYSQINNYLMVCRIIGKDKLNKPIFQNSCLDFICRGDTCQCSTPPIKINEIFNAGGYDWAIIKPSRLDKLQINHIKQLI